MKIILRVKFTVVNHGEEKYVVLLSQKEPTVVNKSNYKKAISREIELLIEKFETFEEKGSNWYIKEYIHIDIDFLKQNH
jgi:hypothetical protein